MNKKVIILILLALIQGSLLRAQTSVEFVLTMDEKPFPGKEKLEVFLFKDTKLNQLEFKNNYFTSEPFQDSAQICFTLPELKVIIPIYYTYNMLLDLKTLTVDIWSDSKRKAEKKNKGNKLVYGVTEDLRGDREGTYTIIEEKK